VNYQKPPAGEPVIIDAPIAETIQEPESAPAKPLPQQPQIQPQIQPHVQPWTSPAQAARRIPPNRITTVELGWTQKLDWRLAGGAALLVAGAVIIVAWAWQNLFSGPSVQRVAATSSSVTPLNAPATQSQLPASAGQSQPTTSLPQTPQPQSAATSAAPASASTGQHVTLEASELTWVAARDATGTQILARVFDKGDSRSLDLPNGATVRVGNAGGLSILLNGNSIGSLGKHGQVREVVFKNGSYKIIVAD
jgi:pyruvate/2-oxoglutarate dehydrogenase complex dihydrolipoamide acyltransferase (E2) component